MLETFKKEWKSATISSIVYFVIVGLLCHTPTSSLLHGLWLSCWFFGGYIGSAMIIDRIKRIEDETKRKRYNTIYNVVVYSLLGLVILSWIF